MPVADASRGGRGWMGWLIPWLLLPHPLQHIPPSFARRAFFPVKYPSFSLARPNVCSDFCLSSDKGLAWDRFIKMHVTL